MGDCIRVVLRVGGERTGHFQAGYRGIIGVMVIDNLICILWRFGCFLSYIFFKTSFEHSIKLLFETYLCMRQVIAQHGEI